MSAPVINPITSILSYRRGGVMPNYAPSATNTPTSWACAPVPAGLAFDTATGILSGTPTAAGLYVLNITAINGSGTSTPLVTTLWIYDTSVVDGPYIALDLDLGGKAVTRPGALKDDPALVAFVGDVVLISLGFKQGDVLQDLGTITSVKVAIKQNFSERKLLEVTTTAQQIGTGHSARYIFGFTLTRSAFQSIINDSINDADTAAEFPALVDVEIAYPVALPGETSPVTRNLTARVPALIKGDIATDFS